MKFWKESAALIVCCLVVAIFTRYIDRTPAQKNDSLLEESSQSEDPKRTLSSSDSVPIASKETAADQVVEFKKEFGEALELYFDRYGFLNQIRGGVHLGATSNDFDPQQPQKVLARALAIIEQARGLIGVEEPFEIVDSNVRTGPYSAQVEFLQKWNGVAIEPYGKVSVDLGSNGELISLYSDYQTQLDGAQIAFELDRLDARAILARRLTEQGRPDRVQGGRKVVWVKNQQGKGAYEFFSEGHQIIVDAINGKTLSQRDQRQF